MEPTTLRKALILLIALGAIALVHWVDRNTPDRLYSVTLYILPIVYVAWIMSRRWVVLVAVLASLTWTAAELLDDTDVSPMVSVINEAAVLSTFLLIGLALSTVRGKQLRLEEANRRIEELLAAERHDARTDPLTGLPNRREFEERLRLEIARCRRDGKPLCLLYLDLDNFKQVNDRHGHGRGDHVLAAMGAALRRVVRESDIPARLGGDEFAVLLWQAEQRGAAIAGERVLKALGKVASEYADCGLGASVGVAWFERPPADPEDALDEADAAMYEAKETRNRVVVINVEREPTQIDKGRSTEPV
jgi:diguanylate cyclase (GGDEF)-like protein